MDRPGLEQLDEKIRQATELIARLRSENQTLRRDLASATKELKAKGDGGRGGAERSKADREALQRMEGERIKIRKKIRHVLRLIEGIPWEDKSKGAQEDLFGPE